MVLCEGAQFFRSWFFRFVYSTVRFFFISPKLGVSFVLRRAIYSIEMRFLKRILKTERSGTKLWFLEAHGIMILFRRFFFILSWFRNQQLELNFQQDYRMKRDHFARPNTLSKRSN